jgi:hypothetical protein
LIGSSPAFSFPIFDDPREFFRGSDSGNEIFLANLKCEGKQL